MNAVNRQIVAVLRRHCPRVPEEALLEMIRAGLIDLRSCKALLVRDQVEDDVRRGKSKIDAIYHAAEDYACSVAFVKRTLYGYR